MRGIFSCTCLCACALSSWQTGLSNRTRIKKRVCGGGALGAEQVRAVLPGDARAQRRAHGLFFVSPEKSAACSCAESVAASDSRGQGRMWACTYTRTPSSTIISRDDMTTDLIPMGLYAAWFLSEVFARQICAGRRNVHAPRNMGILAAGNVLLPLQAITVHALGIGDARLAGSLMGAGGALMMVGAAQQWQRIFASRKTVCSGITRSNEHSSEASGFHRLIRRTGYVGAWIAFAGLGMSLVD